MIRVITIEQGEQPSEAWDAEVNAWLMKWEKSALQMQIGISETGKKSFVALYEEVTESPGPTVRRPRPVESPQGNEAGSVPE